MSHGFPLCSCCAMIFCYINSANILEKHQFFICDTLASN